LHHCFNAIGINGSITQKRTARAVIAIKNWRSIGLQ